VTNRCDCVNQDRPAFWAVLRTRFWLEATLAVGAMMVSILTVAWPAWIEATFSVDPDRGSGAAEWLVVVICFALCTTFSVFAVRDFRRQWEATINPTA
jgi:hypothetical protein